MRTSLLWTAAGATLVGVPAGLALTGGSVDPVLTWSLGFFLALLTLLMRRWPVAVLVVSLSCVAAWRAADLIGAGWVWPATAAFVANVLAGRVRTAIVAGALTLWYGFVWDYYVQLGAFDDALGPIGAEALWLAAALALTQAYRSTRRWQDEVAARLRQTLEQQELEARRRRAEERVDIARDLHDVVSHTLAVVGVHLNVALDAFDADPAEARDAVRLAQDVRGRAMGDLKALVDVLRFEGGEPAHGLEDLDDLADRVRSAGVAVDLTERGERSAVPAPIATAVYRVVQESLTNTVRHAGATTAAVTLDYGPDTVVADITDDGAGSGPVREGRGIMGMRERVATLGGALTAGPRAGGGFTVHATIPLAP